MRFDTPDKRRLKLKLKLKLKLRSRAHLGRQLVARLLTTSHHSPPPSLHTHTHTLRLIAKRGQCDFAPPWPPRHATPLELSRRISIVVFGHFMWQLFDLSLFFYSLVWPEYLLVSVSLSGPERALLRFCCQAILQRLLSKLRNVTAYA